jgi:hypothetical protein
LKEQKQKWATSGYTCAFLLTYMLQIMLEGDDMLAHACFLGSMKREKHEGLSQPNLCCPDNHRQDQR